MVEAAEEAVSAETSPVTRQHRDGGDVGGVYTACSLSEEPGRFTRAAQTLTGFIYLFVCLISAVFAQNQLDSKFKGRGFRVDTSTNNGNVWRKENSSSGDRTRNLRNTGEAAGRFQGP